MTAIQFFPVLDRIDLVAPCIANLAKMWHGEMPINNLQVGEINPEHAGGFDFCKNYGFEHSDGANCLIIQGKRNSEKITAACLIPVGYKADLSGVIKKQLSITQVGLAPKDMVLSQTGMEYGSITIVGLPSSWPILMDSRIANKEKIVIGSGLLRSKIQVTTKFLATLPNASFIDGIGVAPTTGSSPSASEPLAPIDSIPSGPDHCHQS